MFQKQLILFCKKWFLRYFAKFTGKHLCQSLFFNKVAGVSLKFYLKKRLWHRCFPVNLLNFWEHLFYRKPSGDCFWYLTGPKYASVITLHKKVNIYLKIYIEREKDGYKYTERRKEKENRASEKKKRERMRYMNGKRTSSIVPLKVFSIVLATFSKYFATTTEDLQRNSKTHSLTILVLLDAEAIFQRCSLKKVFLQISQDSQENTCARVSFLIKLEA